MMGYGAGLGFGFGGLLALLGCILLVVGVVVLIAWAIGRIGQPQPGDAVAGSAARRRGRRRGPAGSGSPAAR